MVWSDAGVPIRCPDMAGGTLVWSEKRDSDGDYDIYGYDVASGSTYPIYGLGDQTAPRVSGDLVVWADNRDATSGWDVYGFDLNPRRRSSRSARRVSLADGSPTSYGTTVVWVDTRNGNADIYGATIDLAAHTASGFAVCTNTSAQSRPGVCRSHVVWADARGALSHIYGKELAGGAEQRISDLPGAQGSPVVSDRTVLWWHNDEDSGGDYRIDGLNLISGEPFTTDVWTSTWGYPYLYAVDGPRFTWGDGARWGAFTSLYEFGWQSSLTIAGDDAWVTSPALPLALTCTTAWNAITSVRFSEDGTHWSAWRHYGESSTYTLSLGEGQRTLYAQLGETTRR